MVAALIPGHGFASETAETAKDRVVFRAWCVCGQPIVTTARTFKTARRKAWRVYRHHRGFAATCLSRECDCDPSSSSLLV